MRRWLDSTPVRFIEVLQALLGLGLTIGGLLGVFAVDSRITLWGGVVSIAVGSVLLLAAASGLLREECRFCNGTGRIQVMDNITGPCRLCNGRGKRWIFL